MCNCNNCNASDCKNFNPTAECCQGYEKIEEED